MIYTSYFANFTRYVMNGTLQPSVGVSIAQYMPAKINLPNDNRLAPSYSLLYDYKEGKINEDEYTHRYYDEVLSKLDPKIIGNKFENKVLLCYEGLGKFCHRHIVADWLRDAGFVVEELEIVEYNRGQ